MARRRVGFWRRLVVMLAKTGLTVFTRRTWLGMEHLPTTGAVIIVPNHISHADPLISAHFVYDAGRWPQYLGKASVFKVPVLGWLLRRVRQIPVERGSIEAARSLEALQEAIAAGGAVVIYPEGTTTREPDLWPMRGKTGAARLALATGAPVIPLVMWGPQAIFDPRTAKLKVRFRTPVIVAAGPPVDLSRWAGAEPTREILTEMTEVIMLRLRDMLAELRGEEPPPLYTPGRRGVTDGAGEPARDRGRPAAGTEGVEAA